MEVASTARESLDARQSNDAVAIVGRKDGTVQLIDATSGQELCTYRHDGPADGEGGRISGVHLSGVAVNRGISISSDGIASIHRLEVGKGEDSNRLVPERLLSWSIPGGDVYATAFDRNVSVLAVGCKGSELKVYDVNGISEGGGTSDVLGMPPKLEPLFSAKGGARNKVGLSDLPWNSAVAFHPNSEAIKVWVGTGYHKIRLYDRAAGKKPQLEVAFPNGAARITALAPEPNGNRCWVADAQGKIEAYDLRAARFIGSLKGVTGSVRSLALHPTRPLVASVGLDRFLRLHNTDRGGKSVDKLYLKTELNCVAWLPPTQEASSKAFESSWANGKGRDKKNALDEQDRAEQSVGRKKAKWHT